MQEINPFVQIDKHEVALSSENALDILKDYDIVVDGTDNFPTRYLVNDACVLLRQAERVRLDLPLRGPGDGVRLPRAGLATAACIPSRHLPGWFRAAPRAACWAFCRA